MRKYKAVEEKKNEERRRKEELEKKSKKRVMIYDSSRTNIMADGKKLTTDHNG
jgi:hypothetical protein